MGIHDLAKAAETHLDDLQADVEAGSRRLEHLQDAGLESQLVVEIP